MLRIIHTILLMLSLLVLSLGEGAYAAGKWDIYRVDGVDYVTLADLCKFYKLKPKKGREGFLGYGDSEKVISIKPTRQDFYVNNYRYILSYPVRDAGEHKLISTIDVKKLVEPVLRPHKTANKKAISTVVVDPGHGGHDAGAVSPYAREKDCNLAVGLKLKKLLEAKGFNVVMTRSGDYFLTLRQRVEIANRTPNSIFVSIHHNSGRRAAAGIETFTLAPQGTTSPFAKTRRFAELEGNEQDSENIALATAVHSRTIKASKAIDRGIQRARFSVLCTITRPAILFEGGFVSNPEEGRKISSDSYQNMLATSICEGIVAYNSVMSGGLRRTNKRNIPAGQGVIKGTRSIHGNNQYRGTTRLK